MRRPKTTPRVWHSEDGMTTFRMDENGITDICPGPARFFPWPHLPKLKPAIESPNFIHWAMKTED